MAAGQAHDAQWSGVRSSSAESQRLPERYLSALALQILRANSKLTIHLESASASLRPEFAAASSKQSAPPRPRFAERIRAGPRTSALSTNEPARWLEDLPHPNQRRTPWYKLLYSNPFLAILARNLSSIRRQGITTCPCGQLRVV